MEYIIKTALSAVIIVTVAELSQRNQLIGGLIASLPIVSIMAMIWLYIDTQDAEKVSALSSSIFWMVLPSLVLFFILPIFLKKQMPFYLAMGAACLVTSLVYYLAFMLYTKLGIKT